MKHTYTDEQMQAAIDLAVAQYRLGTVCTLPTSWPDKWVGEMRDRLDLIKSALDALPEPSLSQLRPIAEAGEVPEGCVRYYAASADYAPSLNQWSEDTHFADIQLPAAKADDEDKPEPMLTKPISLPLAECMSLRDWFAGQALEGMLSNPESISNKTSVAIHAYGFADAMLAAREVAP